jgi:hypothetical protein
MAMDGRSDLQHAKERAMKNLLAVRVGFAMTMLALPAMSGAVASCPPEVTEAKAALENTQASFKKSTQLAKSQEIQAPRGPQDIQAPRVKKAGDLVRQAEAACNRGDRALAAKKAQEALALLGGDSQ